MVIYFVEPEIIRMPAANPKKSKDPTATPIIERAPNLASLPWLVHGFSTRYGGVSIPPYSPSKRGELNLGKLKWDEAEHVAENRRLFLGALPAKDLQLLTLNQIHSDLLRSVGSSQDADSPCKDSLRGDAHMTTQA